ncbi:MAG: zinc dependent phospholipase C family protein [Dehalococcoidia bacterium]
MPPLVTHMVAARRAAAQLAPEVADGGAGEYLLGATSPDIRVLTGWERARTHFFDLESEEHQDSVAKFFEAHPQLRDASAVSAGTRAWTCGFLTHIVMDEIYITDLYRPYFGRRSRMGGTERANLLDRVLQYELDRREREDQESMAELRGALFACAIDIDSGFIDREMLEQWRDVSASISEHPPDWERFSYIASRHLKRVGIQTESDYQDFLDEIPEMLEESLRSVGAAEVEAFFERVTERSVACLREYLGCP